MADGFLGNDASFMLDVVVCALLLVVPLLVYSLYLAKIRRQFLQHRNLQVTLGILLLITVAAFEIDMHLIHDGWEGIVKRRNPVLTATELAFVRQVLQVHLVFAVSTPFLWATTLGLALMRMPSPPAPCDHSRLHKKLGWLSAVDITLTSITGLAFYYYAFIAGR